MRLHKFQILYAGLICLILLSGCKTNQTVPDSGITPPPETTGHAAPSPQPPVNESPQPEPLDPINELIAQMSIADKIGQMVLVGIEGTAINGDTRAMIKERRAGGIILYGNNIVSTKQTTELVNALKQTNADAGIGLPLLISADQEGGRVARLPKEIQAFPSGLTIGRTNDPAYAYRVGSALGEAMKTLGFNTDYAPVLDINTNPDNPVIGDRSFGATADTVSKMGVQEMNGIRSQGVIAVVKHFPGHGDTSVDSHKGLPVVEHELQRLRDVEFVPFAEAIKQGVDAVMVAHLLMTKLDPDVPASMSRTVIQNILRGELGFGGVVITDDMTMEAVGKVMPIGSASVQAVLAGADIVLVGHGPAKQKAVFDALLAAAQSGEISQSAIDASLYRIIKLKLTSGISGNPTGTADVAELNRHIREALHR